MKYYFTFVARQWQRHKNIIIWEEMMALNHSWTAGCFLSHSCISGRDICLKSFYCGANSPQTSHSSLILITTLLPHQIYYRCFGSTELKGLLQSGIFFFSWSTEKKIKINPIVSNWKHKNSSVFADWVPAHMPTRSPPVRRFLPHARRKGRSPPRPTALLKGSKWDRRVFSAQPQPPAH